MIIGFDIGGTKCAAIIGKTTDQGLRILDKRVIPTDCGVSAYEMLDRLCLLAEQMLCEDDPGQIQAIGISCGGPLNSKTGVIQSPPNLPGWDDICIVEYMQARFGVKAYLQNDANACAVAEWLYGAGRGSRNMIFLTFGTGLGAGLILDGRLYTGTNDMAGEVGHIRLSEYGPVGYGKMGSFEGFCSGGGIAQLGQMLAREKLQMGRSVSYCENLDQLERITAKSIAEQAKNGCEDALEVYRVCGEKLGCGLSVLIDILNPECIVLGSIFERSEMLLRDSMQKAIDRECLAASGSVCRIVPALLGEHIGDYAALSVAVMRGK